MSLTRTAVKTRVRTMLYEPSARYYTEAELNSWVDDACKDISLKTFCNTKIASAINTVSGQATYDYPDSINTTAVNTIGIKTLVDSAGVSLEFATPDLYGRVTDAGQAKWGEWGRKVIITPTPTASNLNYTPYIYIEGTQTAAGTITGVPSMFHHLIPLYCVYKGHEKRGRLQTAQAVWNQYEAEMSRVLQVVNDRYNMDESKQRIQDSSPAD
jgi:hypothetical protein